MPLFINEQKVDIIPKLLTEFISENPHFKVSAKTLRDAETKVVTAEGLLYVGQREFAGTSPSDGVIRVIGSEDATTCHLVIITHTETGSVCVGHFDGCGTEQGINDMLSLVQVLSKHNTGARTEIHLLGGFKDDRNLSEELSIEILNCLCKVTPHVHLVTACITDLNTTFNNGLPFPVIYGIAVDVETGCIYKATFTDKGPDKPLRSARHFTGGHEMLNIYDQVKHHLSIGPFSYRPNSNVTQFCTLPNHIIREHLSTSPEQEPDGFEDSVRAACIQIRDYPDPMKSHFPHGVPRRYQKQEDGTWISIGLID